MTLYLASTSREKLREFSQATRACGITIELLPDLHSLPCCIEDGATFEENAQKKAAHYSAGTEELVLGEDSGLCVDALDGAPGIYSARFAGEGTDDTKNNQKLLAELRRVQRTTRGRPLGSGLALPSAHYVCAIALARGGRVMKAFEGRAEGLILESPRGTGGFGYDPLFFYPPLGKSFAEMALEEKFQISHRGTAFRKLLQYVKAI